jgi:two-component system, response regulator, stage 0 sporulation protein F
MCPIRFHRLLVVDDEPALGRAVGRLLEHVGFGAEVVEGSAEALGRLAQRPFDAALIDLRLTGPGSGLELLTTMRLRGDPTPVIGMTGLVLGHPEVEAWEDWGVEVLCKPFDGSELLEAVQRALLAS